MVRYVNNNEFDKDVIYDKLSDLSSKLEEEQEKNIEERDFNKERELLYAQMIQGLKLNTLFTNRNYFFK